MAAERWPPLASLRCSPWNVYQGSAHPAGGETLGRQAPPRCRPVDARLRAARSPHSARPRPLRISCRGLLGPLRGSCVPQREALGRGCPPALRSTCPPPPEWDPPSCIPAGNERSSPPATQRGAGRARSHAEGAFGCHARAALVTARQSQGSSHAAAGLVRRFKLSEWRAPRKRNAAAEGTEREVSAGAPDAGLPPAQRPAPREGTPWAQRPCRPGPGPLGSVPTPGTRVRGTSVEGVRRGVDRIASFSPLCRRGRPGRLLAAPTRG